MPRGFLVKRTKSSAAYSYRIRNSDDSDSDHEYIQTNFGSPDSGYSPSPISLTPKEREAQVYDRDSHGSLLSSSPLPVTYPSPFYFYAFDRLSVSSNSPVSLTPVKSESATSLSSPNKRRGPSEAEKKAKTPKKPKAARKINFDEDKSSPVSGTIIKDLSDTEEEGRVVCGDIDSAYNYVEITAEAKAELEKIENKIGDYVCQLCKEHYDDAFQLARHRCSRIVHVEYRCPECDKVFNCPANLASHRRWHKPKSAPEKKTSPARILPATPSLTCPADSTMEDVSEKCDSPRILPSSSSSPTSPQGGYPASGQFFAAVSECQGSPDGQFECDVCLKRFRRQAYLRKHVLNHKNERAKQDVPAASSSTSSSLPLGSSSEASTPTGKELTCDNCSTCFPTKTALDKHVRTHSGEVYTCKYCSSRFYSSPGLTRHINKCHPSENRQVILLQLPVSRPC